MSSPAAAKPLRAVVRATITVAVASLMGHVGNYAFYVVSARMLGPADFAEISALVAFATVVFQPFNGVQAAVARDVAQVHTRDDPSLLANYLRQLANGS